jgi:hypothetical protein
MDYTQITVERQNKIYAIHVYAVGTDDEGPLYTVVADAVYINGSEIEVATKMTLDVGSSADLDISHGIAADGGKEKRAEISLWPAAHD